MLEDAKKKGNGRNGNVSAGNPTKETNYFNLQIMGFTLPILWRNSYSGLKTIGMINYSDKNKSPLQIRVPFLTI